ncbi:MAG: M20 family metallo-hydrolase [Prevotella sp.]
MKPDNYIREAVNILKSLIEIPSTSRDETSAADFIAKALKDYGLEIERIGNNILSKNADFNDNKPTLLLNAHIDTVKPTKSWKRDPFTPTIEGDKLFGLGSNDCGGGLVSTLMTYIDLSQKEQSYNLIWLASAEEEVSGENGIRMVIPSLPKIDVAIVGEPTGMQPAIAEKGLIVIDAIARGISGHAAREGGVNAIYKALDDISTIRSFRFEKDSKLLGPTKMSVTIVNAGTQHNVIPDECKFTIDIRTNEKYTNEEVYNLLSQHLQSEIKARSFRLSSSHIDENTVIIKRCKELGMKPFGSPTLSDQALMPFPSFKLGPGDSTRSHSADEFILISEIDNAIKTYIKLLDGMDII